jgi:hypothetical protein
LSLNLQSSAEDSVGEDTEAASSDTPNTTPEFIPSPADPVTPPPSAKKKKAASPKPLRANFLDAKEQQPAQDQGKIAAPGFLVREETL